MISPFFDLAQPLLPPADCCVNRVMQRHANKSRHILATLKRRTLKRGGPPAEKSAQKCRCPPVYRNATTSHGPDRVEDKEETRFKRPSFLGTRKPQGEADRRASLLVSDVHNLTESVRHTQSRAGSLAF